MTGESVRILPFHLINPVSRHFALFRTIYLCKELGEGGDDLIPIVICKEVDSYVI